MDLEFERDQRKAKTNLQKHRVSFDEAATVFDDPLARLFDDEIHSASERRSLIVGYSIADDLLFVCFAELPGNRLRLLSARRATPAERKRHEQFFKQ